MQFVVDQVSRLRKGSVSMSALIAGIVAAELLFGLTVALRLGVAVTQESAFRVGYASLLVLDRVLRLIVDLS